MALLSPKLSRAQLQYQAHSTRDDDAVTDQGSWGTMQITAPIMVGAALLILFAAYIIWCKRSSHSSPLALFSRVRDACVSTFAPIFMSARRRRTVQRVSTTVTLDESMATPLHTERHHHYRHSYIRSDSTDSQTPLTDNVEFYYPPQKYGVDSVGRSMLETSQHPERRIWRWWRVFGFGPREVKSQVPSHCFQIDESSVGHDSLGSPVVPMPSSGRIGDLASLSEQDEGDHDRGFYNRVIQIGDPQITTQSAPMTSAHHEGDAEYAVTPVSENTSTRTPAPEYSSTVGFPHPPSNLRNMTIAPTSGILHHTPGPPPSGSPAPPKYSSVTRNNNPPVNSDPMSLYPGPMRAVGRNLPQQTYETHGRQMSTESVLASSKPMVPPSIY